jgi:hypothetical protein
VRITKTLKIQTELRMTLLACQASSAEPGWANTTDLSQPFFRNMKANSFHHANELMTQNTGRANRKMPMENMDIRAANPCQEDTQFDFTARGKRL